MLWLILTILITPTLAWAVEEFANDALRPLVPLLTFAIGTLGAIIAMHLLYSGALTPHAAAAYVTLGVRG